MDESGIDSKEISPYGCCEPGQRFHAQPPGYGKKRLSIIGGVCGKQFLAPMVDQRELPSLINRNMATRLFTAISKTSSSKSYG